MSYAIVFVSDMEPAVTFYRDVVGLPLKFESPEWTEFATDGATLALHTSEGSVPDRDDPRHMPAGRCRPGLSVPNLDEFHHRMVERRIPCIQEPKEIFGARIAQYLDPDGLAISVSEARHGVTPERLRASGTFEVDLTPQAADEEAATATRLSIVKRFHGDLEATSRGEMLTAVTDVEGSAGYVAIERVDGTLHGRTGAFVLQHYGVMNRGAPHLTVTVVPDSGTGHLVGLAGEMTIRIADGKHFYELEYAIAEAS